MNTSHTIGSNFRRTQLRIAGCYSATTILALFFLTAPLASGDEPVSFSKQIAPILQAKCVACHGAKKAESDYRVDSFAAMMKPANEETPIVAGKPDESLLFQRLVTNDTDLRMPAEGDALPQEQIDAVRLWIAEGAKFDGDAAATLLSQLSPAIVHPKPPNVYPASMPISAICFDPPGKQILTGGYHEIIVWSQAGKVIRRIQNQGERTYSISFHPTQRWILTASGTPGVLGEVRMFNAETGELRSVVIRTDEVIMDAQFSPDGTRIAVAMPDGSIKILAADSFEVQATLLGHSDQVTTVAWHADGIRLATASRDHSAKIFDCDKVQSIATFTGHTEAVNDVAFLHGDDAVSVAADGTAQIWNIRDGKKRRDVLRHSQPLLSVSVAEKEFAVTGVIGVQRFEIGSNKLLQRTDVPVDSLTVSAYSQPQQQLIAGSQAGNISIVAPDADHAQFLAVPQH